MRARGEEEEEDKEAEAGGYLGRRGEREEVLGTLADGGRYESVSVSVGGVGREPVGGSVPGAPAQARGG